MRRREGGRDEKGETERELRGELDIWGNLAQGQTAQINILAYHSDLNVMR